MRESRLIINDLSDVSASSGVSRSGLARAYHLIDYICDWIAATVSCILLSCIIYEKVILNRYVYCFYASHVI